MISGDPIAPGAAALIEAKAYLRIGHSEEDSLLLGLLAGAMALCEQFTGQTMIVRGFSETLPASGAWSPLGRVPVLAIQGIEMLNDGAASLLQVDLYAVDVDAGGTGWVRLTGPQDAKTMRIGYSAGLAQSWDSVPEALRQGIVRLTAHLYTHRDGGEGEGPPAVVSALWRPYRRMRLG